MNTENKAPAPKSELTEADIIAAYRLFLNRYPSDTELARMKAAHSTMNSMRAVFLRSSEFAKNYAPFAPPVAPPPPPQMTAIERAPTLKKHATNLQACDTDRVVFLHVPKCGGTTLHHILGEWFGHNMLHPERFNELYSYTGGQLASSLVFSGHYDFYATTLIPGPQKRISFLRDPAERLVSLYNFHRAHTPEAIARDNLLLPRWANQHDISDYFAKPEIRQHPAIDNMIVRVFSNIPQTTPSVIDPGLREATLDEMLEQALGNLEKFAFVGFMDRYEADVARLARVLDKTPPQEVNAHQVLDTLMESGPKDMRKIEKQRPDAACEDSMEKMIEYDRQFYARARALFT